MLACAGHGGFSCGLSPALRTKAGNQDIKLWTSVASRSVLAQAEPPWVGLEERVCSAAPYDTSSILSNHAVVAAVIAGFGLAGYILLLDRGHEPIDEERRRGHTNGSLLFALAAIIGLTAAFLFSALTGDHCLNAQIQFDYPAVLLATAALLLVSGISVVATSHPRLGDTATTLRVVLALTGVLICLRLAYDYEYSDQIARSYERFLDRTDELVADSPEDANRDISVGSTATIDYQLGLYAEDNWPGRSAEWPGLLGGDLFHTQPPATIKWGLLVTASIAIGGAFYVRARMKPVVARGFSSDGTTSHLTSQGTNELSPAAVAEAAWRRWVGRITVFGAVVIVGLLGVSGGNGDTLMHSPWEHRVTLFAVFTAVVALLIQPPRAGDQRSVPEALRWSEIRSLGHRVIPTRHNRAAPSSKNSKQRSLA